MIGKGKIDISIPKTDYAPGDTISGHIALGPKRPVKARELSISLIGEYKATETRRRIRSLSPPNVWSASWTFGRVDRPMLVSDAATKTAPRYDFKTDTKLVRICGFQQQLDGENEYSKERQYHFEIKLREDTPTGPIRWYLVAKLDVPGGPDITRKLPITIR